MGKLKTLRFIGFLQDLRSFYSENKGDVQMRTASCQKLPLLQTFGGQEVHGWPAQISCGRAAWGGNASPVTDNPAQTGANPSPAGQTTGWQHPVTGNQAQALVQKQTTDSHLSHTTARGRTVAAARCRAQQTRRNKRSLPLRSVGQAPIPLHPIGCRDGSGLHLTPRALLCCHQA